MQVALCQHLICKQKVQMAQVGGVRDMVHALCEWRCSLDAGRADFVELRLEALRKLCAEFKDIADFLEVQRLQRDF